MISANEGSMVTFGRHNTQQNDIPLNDTQHHYT